MFSFLFHFDTDLVWNGSECRFLHTSTTAISFCLLCSFSLSESSVLANLNTNVIPSLLSTYIFPFSVTGQSPRFPIFSCRHAAVFILFVVVVVVVLSLQRTGIFFCEITTFFDRV